MPKYKWDRTTYKYNWDELKKEFLDVANWEKYPSIKHFFAVKWIKDNWWNRARIKGWIESRENIKVSASHKALKKVVNEASEILKQNLSTVIKNNDTVFIQWLNVLWQIVNYESQQEWKANLSKIITILEYIKPYTSIEFKQFMDANIVEWENNEAFLWVWVNELIDRIKKWWVSTTTVNIQQNINKK